MSYKNGKDILPDNLLQELQNYIQGELLYIPKKENNRAGWGELNGTRQEYKKRNKKINQQYNQGTPLEILMKEYCLSEESIRKIVYGN